MASNLPKRQIEDSAAGTKLFFDTYGQTPLEFNAVDIDTATGFFQSKGFDQDAALAVSIVLLKQAKLDDTPIYQILQSLEGFDNLQLSTLVGEILNNNRVNISTLGFRTTPVSATQSRNIAA
jgi:hypothetical protein